MVFRSSPRASISCLPPSNQALATSTGKPCSALAARCMRAGTGRTLISRSVIACSTRRGATGGGMPICRSSEEKPHLSTSDSRIVDPALSQVWPTSQARPAGVATAQWPTNPSGSVTPSSSNNPATCSVIPAKPTSALSLIHLCLLSPRRDTQLNSQAGRNLSARGKTS